MHISNGCAITDTHQPAINMMHISEHCNNTDHLASGRKSFIMWKTRHLVNFNDTVNLQKATSTIHPYAASLEWIQLQCKVAKLPNSWLIVCIFIIFMKVLVKACNKSVIAGGGNISLCWFLRRLLCISNGPDPPRTTCPPCPLYAI